MGSRLRPMVRKPQAQLLILFLPPSHQRERQNPIPPRKQVCSRPGLEWWLRQATEEADEKLSASTLFSHTHIPGSLEWQLRWDTEVTYL